MEAFGVSSGEMSGGNGMGRSGGVMVQVRCWTKLCGLGTGEWKGSDRPPFVM